MDINPDGIFATNNTDPNGINVSGATLQGTIKCAYECLIHAFGDPLEGTEEIAWLVRFNDFTVAKVYVIGNDTTTQYWDIDGFNRTAFVRVSSAVQRSLKEAV
jgi:hypothetical protein